MIGAKAAPIILLDQPQSRLKQISERNPVIVEMIEYAEFQWHGRFRLSLADELIVHGWTPRWQAG